LTYQRRGDMKLILCVVLGVIGAAPVAADLTRDPLPPEISSQISGAQREEIHGRIFYDKNPRRDEFPGWLRKVSREHECAAGKEGWPARRMSRGKGQGSEFLRGEKGGIKAWETG